MNIPKVMKTYDYRTQGDRLYDYAAKMDTFNARQLKKAAEMIDEIASDGERETQLYWESWFDSAIVPLLQEYAEMSSGLLEINKDDSGIVTANLKQERGFTITENCMLRSILLMAHNISMDAKDGEIVLTLTFDCKRYI